MKTIKIIILLVLMLGINLFASVATITALKGSASIQREGSSLNATVGTKLKQKDVIKTDDNSKLQIIFKDETVITLGKNSNFSVDEYLFEDTKEPVAKFGMIKGAMRTITGKIGKLAPQKFSVHTKTSTIGIRGTNFSVAFDKDDSYKIYCTYGAISVTVNGEIYIVKQGFYITMLQNRKVIIKEFTPKYLEEMKKEHFNLNNEKVGRATKNGSLQSRDNNEQLNLTVNEESSIIVQDITDTSTQHEGEEANQNLSELLSSYKMNNASYTGTATVIQSDHFGAWNPGDTKDATLLIDFGADTAALTIDPSDKNIEFTDNPNFSGETFTVDHGLTGTANGTFQGPTGNSVIGNYEKDYGSATPEIERGTYEVSTGQNLH